MTQPLSSKSSTARCPACAGSGAQLCACDLGERTPLNCWSCSGRDCSACGGSGLASEAWLNEPVAVVLPRRDWMVIVGAAREFDVRVPREQGDGGACLDKIEETLR